MIADEWATLTDEVIVRKGHDFHRLTGAAADAWLAVLTGVDDADPGIVEQFRELGLVQRR